MYASQHFKTSAKKTIRIHIYDIERGCSVKKYHQSLGNQEWSNVLDPSAMVYCKCKLSINSHVRLLVGMSVGKSKIPKSAGSYTFRLLSEHLFTWTFAALTGPCSSICPRQIQSKYTHVNVMIGKIINKIQCQSVFSEISLYLIICSRKGQQCYKSTCRTVNTWGVCVVTF